MDVLHLGSCESFVTLMLEIHLGEEMSTVHFFCFWSWLAAAGESLFFLLHEPRKCFTLPVVLPYLKYQIVPSSIIATIVPSTDVTINK